MAVLKSEKGFWVSKGGRLYGPYETKKEAREENKKVILPPNEERSEN